MAQMIKSGLPMKTGILNQGHPPSMNMHKQQITIQQGIAVGPQPGMPGTLLLPPGVIPSSLVTAASMPGISIMDSNSTAARGNISMDINSGPNDLKNNDNLANTKEKTPMCLVNELARYNKIQHQYTLTDEQGPAHKKTFYVKLRLGEEEYSAAGPSIKKAQHAAATIALNKTSHTHPPQKNKMTNTKINSTITPTVELNALAMKRGDPAIYRSIEPSSRPGFYPSPNYDFRGMYNQRYHFPRSSRVFYVSLKVGLREFIGQGNTRQYARHNAAAKALKVLRNLPIPAHMQTEKSDQPEKSENTTEPATKDVATCAKPDEEIESDSTDDKNEIKSEISLVHEIALKRNLNVNFEVVRESGPPHMRTFITRCTVGEFSTDGEGNGKKISKKRSAEKMLEKLKMLPSLSPAIAKPKRLPSNKKKNRNLIKVQKANPSYGVGINPISRLIQIQQAKKEKEPIYTLISERGIPRRREFVMQVQVGEHKCTGTGPNKKLAKRSAAEAMLQMLGYSRPSPQPTKPAIKTADSQAGGDKRVTFMDPSEAPVTRQVVPGVLLMPDSARNQAMVQGYIRNSINKNSNGNVGNASQHTTAAIAKELLDTGASPTAEGLKAGAKNVITQSVIRPKQQLLYLADVLRFQVQFTDFPKGNKTEFLSLVSLSTTPPQVSHGNGSTLEASHDMAALTALRSLSERGIDAVAGNKTSTKVSGTDGSKPILGESCEKTTNGIEVNKTTIKKEANN